MIRWIDLALGIVGFIRKEIGKDSREWAEWAALNPAAAAIELKRVAGRLDARGNAFRNPNGWRARRNHNYARAMREQARDLELLLAQRECLGDPMLPPWRPQP